MSINVKQLWNKSKIVLFQFYFSLVSHVRAALVTNPIPLNLCTRHAYLHEAANITWTHLSRSHCQLLTAGDETFWKDLLDLGSVSTSHCSLRSALRLYTASPSSSSSSSSSLAAAATSVNNVIQHSSQLHTDACGSCRESACSTP